MARHTSPKPQQTKAAASGQSGRSPTGLAERKAPVKKVAPRKAAAGVATRNGKVAIKGGRADTGRRVPVPGTPPAGVPEELLRIWADFKSTGSGERMTREGKQTLCARRASIKASEFYKRELGRAPDTIVNM